MKITYDKSVDAAYIYLTDTTDPKAVKTYLCNPLEVEGMINLDFDIEGKLIGIEVMDASSKLTDEALSNSEFTKDQLITISNALNEIINGPDAIDESEFHTRIGATKQEAENLLTKVAKYVH